jgi:fatty acid desaturase
MDNHEKINWYRSPVDKEKLIELTQKRNLRPLMHIVLHLSFSAITGTATFLAWKYLAWPFWGAALYIHCALLNFLGPTGVFHELTHRTVFKSRWLNEFFIRVCGFLTWSNFVKFRTSHLRQHHPNTLITGRDYEVMMPAVFYPIDVFFCLTIPLYNRQSVSGIFDLFGEYIRYCFGLANTEQDKRLFPESDKKLRRQLFNWARITVIGHIILAAIFIYFDLWILLFVVTFARAIAPGFSLLFRLSQHIGLKDNVTDYRICCRTMKLGPIMSFFYWNMNYHTEHHMYAAVPYYNLPKLHALIKDDLPQVKKGLLNNWKDIWPVVKRQRTEPEYCLVPQLPTPSPDFPSGQVT